jgi:hypothetical protein
MPSLTRHDLRQKPADRPAEGRVRGPWMRAGRMVPRKPAVERPHEQPQTGAWEYLRSGGGMSGTGRHFR